MSARGRFDVDAALRPALRGMDGYEPIDPPEEAAARYGVAPGDVVKLDGNENPYGPSPRARQALAGGYEAHRYPDPDQRRLRAAIAARHGIHESSVVAGAGADELIDLVFRVFADPGDRVVIASPTFGMYGFGARLSGATLVDAPRLEADWSIDADALVDAARGATAVFIPSPNNPTGGLLPHDVCERLLATGALLVVDEAYIEFAHGESLVERAAAGDAPLIVLRTFSKWAGLAGLRVGYGVMPRPIAEAFMHWKQPYGVNLAAEAAAIASIEDAALLDERACAIAGERERMEAALREGGRLDPAPSEANFLLCHMADRLGGDGAALREALARRGVFVRFFSDPRLRRHVRISAGAPDDTDRVLAALDEAGRELEG